MAAKDWTDEQLENLMRYGVCWECGDPREISLTRSEVTSEADGTVTEVHEHRLVCPNGHPQG